MAVEALAAFNTAAEAQLQHGAAAWGGGFEKRASTSAESQRRRVVELSKPRACVPQPKAAGGEGLSPTPWDVHAAAQDLMRRGAPPPRAASRGRELQNWQAARHSAQQVQPHDSVVRHHIRAVHGVGMANRHRGAVERTADVRNHELASPRAARLRCAGPAAAARARRPAPRDLKSLTEELEALQAEAVGLL